MTKRTRLPAGSELDRLVAQACDLERQIAALPPRRLSADSFLKQALERAHADDVALDIFLSGLDEAPAARAFVSELARLIADGRVTGVPASADKMNRLAVYGGTTIAGDLAEAGGSLPLALAAAVKLAAKRWPTSFGEIADLDAFDKEAAVLRDKLEHAYEQMREAVTGADLSFDQGSLSPSERDRGLALIKFKRWPTVVLGPDWPKRITAAAMAEADSKAEEAA